MYGFWTGFTVGFVFTLILIRVFGFYQLDPSTSRIIARLNHVTKGR